MTELSPETRALLAAADVPKLGPSHRAHLKEAILTRAAEAPLVTAATVTGSRAGVAAMGTKIAVVSSAVGVIVAGAMWNSEHTSSAPPARPTAVVVEPSAPVPVVEIRAPTSVHDLPDAPPLLSASGARRPVPAVRPAPTVTAEETSSPEPSPEPSALMLREEANLLRRAHVALEAGDVSMALGLLDDHARRFPNGVLEPERSADHAIALCRLGRTTEAQAAVQRFLAVSRPPHLKSKVLAACGNRRRVDFLQIAPGRGHSRADLLFFFGEHHADLASCSSVPRLFAGVLPTPQVAARAIPAPPERAAS